MFLQHLAKDITESIIIIQAANLGDHSKPLEGFIVQFVDEGQVRVGDHHVGQLLYISQTMCKTVQSVSNRDSSQCILSRAYRVGSSVRT